MVVHFPRHHWTRCENRQCLGCHLCHGGLALCTRCRGMEGSLPTDCPGERMTDEQEEAVYAGKLDWRYDRGWIEEASYNSPARYQK